MRLINLWKLTFVDIMAHLITAVELNLDELPSYYFKQKD